MNRLDDYLREYFVTADELGSACGIGARTLDALVDEGLVPRPSYTVTRDDRLVSQAFGELPASGARAGKYFRLATCEWVRRAEQTRRLAGEASGRGELERRFRGNFSTALLELDRSILRLRDSVGDAGEIIAAGMDARTLQAWEAYIAGIFSLCVADPSSERSIARKEVLQEALAALSNDGARNTFTADEVRRLTPLIDDYAAAAMPFAPPEYPRSSRKRLVDDLRAKLRPIARR